MTRRVNSILFGELGTARVEFPYSDLKTNREMRGDGRFLDRAWAFGGLKLFFTFNEGGRSENAWSRFRISSARAEKAVQAIN